MFSQGPTAPPSLCTRFSAAAFVVQRFIFPHLVYLLLQNEACVAAVGCKPAEGTLSQEAPASSNFKVPVNLCLFTAPVCSNTFRNTSYLYYREDMDCVFGHRRHGINLNYKRCHSLFHSERVEQNTPGSSISLKRHRKMGKRGKHNVGLFFPPIVLISLFILLLVLCPVHQEEQPRQAHRLCIINWLWQTRCLIRREQPNCIKKQVKLCHCTRFFPSLKLLIMA